jgi:NhaP-type Na+/H+ or K+/H+ antiporter
MVVFLVLLDIVKGEPADAGQVALRFCRLSFGGPLLGLVFGIIVQFILGRIHNQFVLEVNTTFVASYLVFFIAEGTSLHVSGILALVALGLFMNKQGKTRISAESEHALHHVWGYIGFMAETVIFILSGIIMGLRASQGNAGHKHPVTSTDFLLVLANYACLHVIRFTMILLFWPILRKLAYGMEFSHVILCSYAGLRGAVGLALALMVVSSEGVDPYVKDIILLHVGGVALLTLLINATTTGMLVRKLGLSNSTNLQKNILVGIT